MIKNTIIALVAAASLGSLAAPAMAITSIVPPSDDEQSTSNPTFDSDAYLLRLHNMGVNATDVEQWGQLVRAYVTREDGTQAMQFFTPDSLTPVNL